LGDENGLNPGEKAPQKTAELFHGRFILSEDSWPQYCAILRNAFVFTEGREIIGAFDLMS